MMMKICTDVEQSNKLIELGIDVNTADMCYHFIKINKTPLCIRWEKVHDDEKDNSVPAWSLAALLDVLPDSIYDNTNEFSQLEFTKKSVAYIHGTTDGIKLGALKDNLVDACVEMIIRLHELNML